MKKSRLDKLDKFLSSNGMSDEVGGTFETIDSMLSNLGLERKKEREETVSAIKRLNPYVNFNSREMKSYAKDCIENKKEFVLYVKKVPRGYHAIIYLLIKK